MKLRLLCSAIVKLGIGGLVLSSALVPSTAHAYGASHGLSRVTICTPNASTCTQQLGQTAKNTVDSYNMPYAIDATCSGASPCSNYTPQQWSYSVLHAGGGIVGPYSVSNPVTGLAYPYTPAPSLPGGCAQISTGYYKCVIGTGGPWGSWVLTAYYF
jgi:hypothetical protein